MTHADLAILGKQVIIFTLITSVSIARKNSKNEHIEPDTFIQISPTMFSSYEL